MTAMSGSYARGDGRPTLRFERLLPHPVERVWRAVTEPAELERWFVGAAGWTPALGERFDVLGAPLEIVELDPPRRFAWTHGTQRFSFDLERAGDGTRLVFAHAFDDESLAAQQAAGWDAYLDRLDALLAGRFLSKEDAHASFPERHRRYRERFDAAG